MRIMEPARWKGSWMDVLLTRSGSATMKKNVIGSCGMSVNSQNPVSCGTCSRDREGERKRKEAREEGRERGGGREGRGEGGGEKEMRREKEGERGGERESATPQECRLTAG
mmetsp:Transcript_34329/g.55421  ORF Transcript_34329/g.55421 Transcript_34329/m.55421 type:complete len:111 (-) Transcript_34329:2464-2796(-)